MISTSLKIVVTIVFISLATPIFSQSTKVYEYWLDKFLLPNLRQKFNDHKIIDEISVHLKGELATVLKVKKLLNKGVQAEFSEPAQYFNQELIAHKSRVGKANLKNFEKILNNLEHIYEVDKHILLAIWANETFFGKVLPKFDALQVLTLLSFSSKNRAFYLRELIYLIDSAIENKIDNRTLKVSKAGALGQPQFLPSTLV